MKATRLRSALLMACVAGTAVARNCLPRSRRATGRRAAGHGHSAAAADSADALAGRPGCAAVHADQHARSESTRRCTGNT